MICQIDYVCMCNYRFCIERRSDMMREITRPALAEAILSANPPILVEALPRRYYDSGHLPTAQPLPPDEYERALALVPDKDKPIVVYCASVTCRNSHQAAAFLTMRGYRNVAVYAGGKQDWTEAGLRLDM
jgi:rhodanese-related sulfurtransferase